MTAPTTEVPEVESGLSIDEIEARLCHAARRHHLEERNIAYWLLEIDERGLHKERGFSSIGDYAMELVGIKPRKAHYLVLIASRLRKLPRIREAFDAGELSWTKAREITSVATPETEAEWLAKARSLNNRDLEKEVRRHAGLTSGEFATVTISMPVEVLEMWNDACELAERVSGTELEKWQVLEPCLVEFLGTHLPTDGAVEPETEGESELPVEVRMVVFNRDGWQCRFPGCSMRRSLDPHHIAFRSRGGDDDPENVITLCRMHHDLVHRGICRVTGRVGADLQLERPRLVSEQEPRPEVVTYPPDIGSDVAPSTIDEARARAVDEVVAHLLHETQARGPKARAPRGRTPLGLATAWAAPRPPSEHVFTETAPAERAGSFPVDELDGSPSG